MSHVEEVEIECHDLSALKTAVERCGGEFMENQTSFAWWGTWVGDWKGERSAFAQGRDPKTFGRCAHAIRVKGTHPKNGSSGPWEIGVVPKGDGWALDYDNYGGAGRALEAVFGKSCMRLKDELAAEITMRELLRDGYRLSRTTSSTGEIVLQANR